jgi:hypothetical protein
MNQITKSFINPSSDYRPLPFWSWNDELCDGQLKRQLGELAKSGVGGYFMHSRAGILTEYLGKDWMDCIGTGLREGSEKGLQSWVYDESGWPSGFADGLVTALGDEYHARGLDFALLDADADVDPAGDVLGFYEYNTVLNIIKKLPKAPEKGLSADSKLAVVRHTSGPYYIDVLNKKVVAAFIRFTHEKYYGLFGDEFGRALQGFFTDEPRLSQGDIPWSYILPEKFSEKYGYDLVGVLPALFIACEGYEKIRYDFWQLVSELFVTAFMKQIYDWCEAHNCKLTGHMMMEESLYSQMTGTSGSMPFYEYMSMPGMDWLRRMIYNPIIPKQVSSAACQTGKKFVLTESFALCGWNVSFEELKWIAEWQFVNGVNRMCQHLFAYSLRGFRKRDYPPSHFFQQPWWKEYNHFNAYIARLGVLLTEGAGVADALVLHPMRSGWVAYDGKNNETLKKLDADFALLAQTMSALHVDYHLGDETYIKKYGRIDGSKLIIGQCGYKAVVLPAMITCDEFTARLLIDFIKAGGTVIAFGELPKSCGGERSGLTAELAKTAVLVNGDASKLLEALKSSGAAHLSIAQDGAQIGDISYQLRDLSGARLAFMVNLSKEKAYKAKVLLGGLRGDEKIARVNIENGTLTPIEGVGKDGGKEIDLEFLPMQSHMILFGRQSVLELPELQAPTTEKRVVRPGKSWRIAKQDPNAVTLDVCDCSIDGGAFERNVPVITLFERLLEMKKSSDLALRFHFDAQLDLGRNKALYLITETPEKFTITVNGTGVVYKDIGWWKDTAFKKLDIRPYLKNGINEILLECRFYQSQKVYDVLFGEDVYETELNKLTYDTEIENLYLVGDFSVFSKGEWRDETRSAVLTDGPFVLRDRIETVETGDLTRQGYAFFAGSLLLEQEMMIDKRGGTRILLDIGVPDAAVSKLFVNGAEIGTVAWRPYTADITDAVTQGKNTVGVQLFSGNRNLLGPHHHTGGELYNVGPESFKGKWSWCDRPTEAVESNEQDMDKDYWLDGYCMVRFGLCDNRGAAQQPQ